MTSRSWLLVMDFGTSGVTASAIDPEQGTIQEHAAKKYEWLHPRPGLTEIDPDEIWECSQEALDDLLEQLTNPFELRGIGFSFFGDNIVPMSESGEAVDNLLPAIDGRSREQVPDLLKEVSAEEYYRLTGGVAGPMCVTSKILWLKKHRPEVYERARSYDHIQQYIFRRMGFGPESDYSMMSRKMLYDIRTREWSRPLMKPLGITSEAVEGPIHESTRVLGTINRYGNVELPGKTPVVLGAHDVTCGMIGGGAIPQNRGVFSDVTGTFVLTGRVTDQLDLRYEHSDPRCWFTSGPRADQYTFFAAIPTAGALLEWFVREFRPADSENAFQELFGSVDFDGTNQLLTVPYFDQSRGVLSGLDLSTGKTRIFQSLVEGITHEFRSILEASGPLFEDPIRTIHSGGGGSKAPQWLQLKANVAEKRVRRVSSPEIQTVGSAVLAFTALGLYDGIEEAVSDLVTLEESYYPQSKRVRRYDKRYQEYEQLKAGLDSEQND